MRKFVVLSVLLLALTALMGTVYAQDGEETLTVVTYDSFALSDEVIAAFEAESGVKLEILRLADAGAMVNQAILTEGNPLGDVMYGVDNTFLSRALDGGIFEPYVSPLLENVPEQFQLDVDENRVTPVAYGDVCLNYDVAYFEEQELALPESLMDLTLPEYKGLLAVQDPALSSPGLAFLLTTVAAFGEEGDYTFTDFWADLVDNDVLVNPGWSETYYGAFTLAGGDRPLVVSYASSPPVEVYYAEEPPETAPTGSIVADGMCFRQIEFTAILAGTEKLEAAQAFIDFSLSLTMQEDLPLQMFVFPVMEDAELPDLFVEYAAVPENPVSVDYAAIDENREAWIQAWQETIRQ